MTALPSIPRALARARRDTAFLAAGIPLHLTTVLANVGLLVATASKFQVKVWAAVPVWSVLLLALNWALTGVQRRRHRALLGVDIPRLPTPPEGRGPRRALGWLRSSRTWRQVAYHTLLGLPFAVMELLALAVWATGVLSATVFVWVGAVPAQMPLSDFGHATRAAYLTAGGLALLCAAPWLVGAARGAEARVAMAMLGPGRAEELQRRVEDLAERRADLVEAVDAERRRIERNLHDGTQQRLVSLAVNLGLAKATLTDLDEAREVIDQAHREAKEAIGELNDLVRGLHPAVLEDRGLDAALSGLAARVPLPVRLRVDLEERVAPTVESVAYFVVSEALTNVTKHAHATRVDVTVKRIGEMLRVNITDNGAGGADPSAGTGLSGLAKRVGSVDGTFRISSPAGGPTTITVELPCEP